MPTFTGTDGADSFTGLGDDEDIIFGHDAEDTSATAGIINAVRVGTGFDNTVAAVAAPGDPGFLYVVEKESGEIHRLDLSDGSSTLFLNIPNGELTPDGEQGLLSLAFHPEYATNGRFFVHMVNAAGNLQVREYDGEGDPDQDPVQTIITIPHPGQGNHNGGTLAFGPNDGYLYYSVGDGGGSNDPDDNAQDLGSLLGKVLRLDVDTPTGYLIPADNPFVGAAGADEIWAYGLRNPFRMSFDTNGDLYIGDVGQSAREEIDFQPFNSPGGVNYGWDIREGTVGPALLGSVDPIFEYAHNVDGPLAVTGGVVYRGAVASMQGHYFLAEFYTGQIWSLEMAGGEATNVSERTSQVVTDVGELSNVAAFSVDAAGDMYAVTIGGDIFRLTPTSLSSDVGDTLNGAAGDDQIYGGAGDDDLDGGADNDRLFGGFGEDGLEGRSGNDWLDGNAGADRLKSGSGKDRFYFTSELGNGNVDRVQDFSVKNDSIRLDQDIFDELGLGKLAAGKFHVGSSAHDGNDRIIYNKSTGALLYDENGDDSGGSVRFATLDKGLNLGNGDFFVV